MRLLIIGGRDAGIEAGLNAAVWGANVELLVADAYPKLLGLRHPVLHVGDAPDWRDLAHHDQTASEAAGQCLHLGTRPRLGSRSTRSCTPPTRGPLPTRLPGRTSTRQWRPDR